jgi:hypothetical protein
MGTKKGMHPGRNLGKYLHAAKGVAKTTTTTKAKRGAHSVANEMRRLTKKGY